MGLPYATISQVEKLVKETKTPSSSGGDIELKTINGQSIKGSGNIAITTYQAFPAAWPTDNKTTTKLFCQVIDKDESAVIGMGYFGGARFSDKPQGLANFDIVVEVLEGPNSTKAIHLIGTSSSVYPYRWEYTYWSHGSVSGWRGVQPEIGINPTLTGNEETITALQFGNTKYKVGGGASAKDNTNIYVEYEEVIGEDPNVWVVIEPPIGKLFFNARIDAYWDDVEDGDFKESYRISYYDDGYFVDGVDTYECYIDETQNKLKILIHTGPVDSDEPSYERLVFDIKYAIWLDYEGAITSSEE